MDHCTLRFIYKGLKLIYLRHMLIVELKYKGLWKTQKKENLEKVNVEKIDLTYPFDEWQILCFIYLKWKRREKIDHIIASNFFSFQLTMINLTTVSLRWFPSWEIGCTEYPISFEKLLFLSIVSAQMHQHQVELKYVRNEHVRFGLIVWSSKYSSVFLIIELQIEDYKLNPCSM